MGIFLIIIEIIVFSIVVSLDNAILIGLLTKDMEDKEKKKASLFGALLGVSLRLVLAFIFYFILQTEVPIIYIIGGVFVVIAGLMTVNSKNSDEKEGIDSNLSIFKVVLSIFLVDAMLSFDNSIAIADQTSHITDLLTKNEVLISIVVITSCTLISFPIVYFGSTSLSGLLKESKSLVYISAYLLISVGIGMVMEDPIFNGTFADLPLYGRLLIQYLGAATFIGGLEGIKLIHSSIKNK